MRGAQANGEQIQAVRKLRGLTQEQLASLAGVDVKTARKAERGQRLDLGPLTKISFALNVDVGSLIVVTPSPRDLEIRRRDAVLRWLRCWDARDMEGLLSLFDDAVVLHLPGGPNIPFSGEHRGKEAMRRANEIAWSTCETDPTGKEDYDWLVSDNVIVQSGKKGVCLPSGEVVQLWAVHIFTFGDGSDLVVEMRVEYDTLTFARLLQLPPAASSPTDGE